MKQPSKKIHIDVVEKYFYPVTAGIEVNIAETYSVLVKQGFDVTIHTSKDTLAEKNILPDTDLIKGIVVKRYPFRSDNFGYFPKIDWQNTDLVCLHNFNVFYFWILLYCFFLKITGQKKFGLVITPHGGFNPEWSIFNRPTAGIKALYHYVVGTFLINSVVDAMRAVSEWERKEIIKKGVRADKVLTISNGIEDEAYMDVEKLASVDIKEKVESWGRYVVQVGRVYPIKNCETTIRALALTPRDLKFVVVGPIQTDEENKNYKPELDKLILELGLEGRVIFTGVIRGIDKFYLIKHAQMMTHMAIWESFCNVVHEGLSQGLICLVANNTALPLLIKDGVNGYCIGTYNYAALAEKINFVLENKDSEFFQEMSQRNKIVGSETRWSNVAEKMQKLYLSLIKHD